MTNRQRVIFVRNGGRRDELGGAEISTLNSATWLGEDGFDVKVATSSDLMRERGSGRVRFINWARLKEYKPKPKAIALIEHGASIVLRSIRAIVFLVRHRKDIVIVSGVEDMIAFGIANFVVRRNLFWYDHAEVKHTLTAKGINTNRKLLSLFSRYVKTLIVVSELEKDLVESAVQTRVSVLNNGVKDRLHEFPTPKRDGSRLIFNSRVLRTKGIFELLEAVTTLIKNYPDLRLEVVGDGADIDDAKDYITQKSLEGIVTVEGYQDNPLLSISKADIFVMPSYSEGVSLSLLEAAMMAKPIITTNIEGNREVFDNDSAILVRPMQTEAVAEAIKRLLDDELLRHGLAESARSTYLSKFSQENHMQSLLRIIRS